MPQMAPMLWLTLFCVFTATFMIFLIMNYFIKPLPTDTPLPPKFKSSEMNWKW